MPTDSFSSEIHIFDRQISLILKGLTPPSYPSPWLLRVLFPIVGTLTRIENEKKLRKQKGHLYLASPVLIRDVYVSNIFTSKKSDSGG